MFLLELFLKLLNLGTVKIERSVKNYADLHRKNKYQTKIKQLSLFFQLIHQFSLIIGRRPGSPEPPNPRVAAALQAGRGEKSAPERSKERFS